MKTTRLRRPNRYWSVVVASRQLTGDPANRPKIVSPQSAADRASFFSRGELWSPRRPSTAAVSPSKNINPDLFARTRDPGRVVSVLATRATLFLLLALLAVRRASHFFVFLSFVSPSFVFPECPAFSAAAAFAYLRRTVVHVGACFLLFLSTRFSFRRSPSRTPLSNLSVFVDVFRCVLFSFSVAFLFATLSWRFSRRAAYGTRVLRHVMPRYVYAKRRCLLALFAFRTVVTTHHAAHGHCIGTSRLSSFLLFRSTSILFGVHVVFRRCSRRMTSCQLRTLLLRRSSSFSSCTGRPAKVAASALFFRSPPSLPFAPFALNPHLCSAFLDVVIHLLATAAEHMCVREWRHCVLFRIFVFYALEYEELWVARRGEVVERGSREYLRKISFQKYLGIGFYGGFYEKSYS